MPPLNTYVVDDPFINGAGSHAILGNNSTSSFGSELNDDDLVWKYAFHPAPRKKSVSFNTQIRVERLPNRYDWPEEERAARWLSPDEYTHFQLDIFNTIYLLRNDPVSMDDATHSARGVECRDPIATRRRRQIRKESRDVVIERQKIQRQRNDEHNGYVHLVASMYCYASQNAMRLALDIAAQDEIDASKIRIEEERIHDEFDFFSHDWVGANTFPGENNFSQGNSMELSSLDDDEDFGFSVFGEKSGFDDSWLRGDV